MVHCNALLVGLVALASISSFLVSTRARKLPPPWAQAHGLGNFDGDIVVDSHLLQLAEDPEGEEGGKYRGAETRNIIKGSAYLWPGGVVPYVIHSIFDSHPLEKKAIQDAVTKINSYSCVRFVPRTNEQYYISFNRDKGCSSYVGRLQTAAQPVSIGPGCAKVGTVLHEMLHVVGFFHTSSRHDRDSYVNVFPDNVITGYEHNFWKYRQDEINHLGAPYDKQSLMQPPRLAWSTNGQSTVESRRMPSEVLGRVDDVISDIDAAQLNGLYKCTNKKSCFTWLGMQDGRITDSQLIASSYLSYYKPHQARLHLQASSKGNAAWCPSQNYAQGEWLQIDFGSVKEVRGIATQGKMDFFRPAWVSHYSLRYSIDGSTWTNYSTLWPYGLSANVDENSIQYNTLPYKVSARYIRVLPIQWYNEACMRLEVYGC